MLLPFGLLAVAVLALVRRKSDDWEYEKAEEQKAAPAAPLGSTNRRRTPVARLALVAAFTSLFFAGAAFTAGAGDQLVKMLAPDDVALIQGSAAADAAAAAAAAAETAPVAAEAAPAATLEAAPAALESVPAAAAAAPMVDVTSAVDAAAAPDPAQAADPSVPVSSAPLALKSVSSHAAPQAVTAPTAKAPTPAPAMAKAPTQKKFVLKPAAAPAPTPEIEPGYGEPTVWLNRALPDPTPPSARLTRHFAHQLMSVSRQHGADWATVLGILRAQGERGSAPASAAQLSTIADQIANQESWRGALVLSGRTDFADSATALADLYRAVGIEALVTGFEAAKDRLAKRVLAAENVWIYDGGREDIAAGQVDVRLLVVIAYMKERHGEVTISSLVSGHRKFARPGVISAHVFGHAMDIAAVGEISIAGNQQPGGITEAAVRSLLLLPAELQPRQVISLLGLGGPSFPMRDHGDHIHVGF